MKHYSPTGLSLPTHLMKRIDEERGDISRSRYILRLLEKVYKTEGGPKAAVTSAEGDSSR